MNKCKKCGKSLVPIGTKRKNGKNHKDWDSRKYHKKCWNEPMIWDESKFNRESKNE